MMIALVQSNGHIYLLFNTSSDMKVCGDSRGGKAVIDW